jgi:aminotransferase
MTGWRVGYLIGPEDVMQRLLLLHAAEVASIPTFLQDACIAALSTSPKEMADTYERRREYVCKRLDEMGLSYPKPEGAFYVFPDISKYSMTGEEFCTRMIKEAKVAAVPGSCFGCEGHIRLSYACADSDLKKGLDRLENFLSSL